MQLEGDVPCPHCGKKFVQRMGEMREGRSRRCPHCGVEIRFKGNGGPEAQKAIDELTKSMSKLKINIKL